MGYSTVNVDELPAEGPGGAVRFVRRHLGVGAFGINWFELRPNAEGRPHDESDTQQEEVNICIGGSGVYRVADEEVPCAGRLDLPLRPRHDATAGGRP